MHKLLSSIFCCSAALTMFAFCLSSKYLRGAFLLFQLSICFLLYLNVCILIGKLHKEANVAAAFKGSLHKY